MLADRRLQEEDSELLKASSSCVNVIMAAMQMAVALDPTVHMTVTEGGVAVEATMGCDHYLTSMWFWQTHT